MAVNFEPQVGARLRVIREQQGLSLRELAGRCGLSFNAISKIERGENSPTVSTLHRLATALKVSIADFFEETQEKVTVFTRRDQRLRSDARGIMMESLGVGLQGQQMEPFLVTVNPGAGNVGDPITHDGEEFVHCLEGTVHYHINDEIYTLETGDSLLFEASQPHAFYNTTENPARLLIIFQAGDGKLLAGQHHLQV